MSIATQVDKIGDKLSNATEGDEFELGFNHTVTVNSKVIGVDENSESADVEVLVELENGEKVVVHVDTIQVTPKDELNHYENSAYILKSDGTKPKPFGEVTKID